MQQGLWARVAHSLSATCRWPQEPTSGIKSAPALAFLVSGGARDLAGEYHTISFTTAEEPQHISDTEAAADSSREEF